MTARDATDLEREIAKLIIDTLNRENLEVTDLPPEQPLFGEGLGLDSIEALALQKRHGLRIDSDAKTAKAHFASVAALARFVAAQQSPCAG